MIIRQVINSVFQSCSYIISQDDASWLVDCGDVDKIVPMVKGDLRGVLITHPHFDHIYGLNRLIETFPAALVLTNEDGKKGLLDDKLNFSRYHEEQFVLNSPQNIKLVTDGETMEMFDGCSVKAVFTPGHCPGCVTWVMDKAIFTGDSLIPGVDTVTNFPHSDKLLAARSEVLIRKLALRRQIYAGHPSQY